MYQTIRPLLFRFGAEGAHNLAVLGARLGQSLMAGRIERRYAFSDPALHQEVFGLTFTNPVGLAAGFDKNARTIPFWKSVGAGFVEVGSISARKSRGNPRPRAFRLPEDRSLINRMGLNNDGAERIAPRVRSANTDPAFPVGVNIAKTHDPDVRDFCESFRLAAPVADYIALNVSCPNTREGKTFEDPNVLDQLLSAIMPQRKEHAPNVPVLIKLSPPDSTRFVLDSLYDELILVATSHGVDGFIATNTASDRRGLTTSDERLEAIGRGGLSGPPLAERSNALIRYLYQKTGGTLPIIGVGGIDSAEAAYEKIRAGASLVQVYTALVYEGPALIRGIKEGLVRILHERGHSAVANVVGEATR